MIYHNIKFISIKKGAINLYVGRGEIGTLPLGRNGREKYDIVYLGGLIPNYSNSQIPNLFYNDYVFLFSTHLLYTSEDSNWYGHVDIDLLRHDYLSYFNYDLRERGSFHVLTKEPLILNEFLEVRAEESEQGIQIIAHLKKQNILNKDHKVALSRDFHILLVKENRTFIDNLPILELGPEFQAKLKHDKALERLDELNSCLQTFRGLAYRNTENSEVEMGIEVAKTALGKDINEAEKEVNRAFNHCLNYRQELRYISKRM